MIIKPYVKSKWDSVKTFLVEEENKFIDKQKESFIDSKELFEFIFYCYAFPVLMGKAMEGALSDYHEFFATIPIELFKTYLLLKDEDHRIFIYRIIKYFSENAETNKKYKDNWDAKFYVIALEDVCRYSSQRKILFESLSSINSEVINKVEPYFEERVEFIKDLCLKGDYYPEFFKDYYLFMYKTRFEKIVNSKRRGLLNSIRKLIYR